MMSGSKAHDTIIIEERQNRRKDIMMIGFIGLGNMATAMIGGMLQKGIAAPEDIIGSARTETTVEKVKTKFNINTTTDNKIVAAQADILFLASETHLFPGGDRPDQRCRGRGYPDRQHCGRKNSGLSERGFSADRN